jgi:hypothetical protein
MVRTLEQTLPTLRRHLLEPFQPDIFVHTYDRSGLSGDIPDVNGEMLSRLLQPVDFRVVSQAEKDPEFLRERDRLYMLPGPVGPGGIAREQIWKLRNVLSQLWHVRECDRLRQGYEDRNGIRYDVVIRARMDSLFTATPEPLKEHGLAEWPKQTVFVPDHAAYGGVCDQFAMGERESMRVHCDYFTHFEKVFCSRPVLPRGYGAAEGLLKRYLLHVAKIRAIEFRIPFEIQREGSTSIQSQITDAYFRRYMLMEAA